jgi:hypothetical protein
MGDAAQGNVYITVAAPQIDEIADVTITIYTKPK